MNFKRNLSKYLSMVFLLAVLFIFIAPDYADARRGRGFGGRRSMSKRTSKPRRSTAPKAAKKPVPKNKQTSFGGTRMNSAKDYTSKYGTPRKAPQTISGKNAAGGQQRYLVHSYGGYGSGLMTGYLMGTTSWMWMMPFHPAFYYSKPYYVNNADGTMSVYPPTFSSGKLLFTLLIVGGIIWIIYRVIRNKRRGSPASYSRSSFG